MGQRSPMRGRLAPCLEHNHRLGIGRRTQRTHEAPGVGNAFQVNHDAVGFGICGQEVERLRQVHCRVRPQRNHGRKSHRVFLGPIENRRGERARLRDQRQRTRRGQGTGNTGVQIQVGSLESQAVGA